MFDAIAALKSPHFSHTRIGSGCWREVVWIYHRDPSSPSGVHLAGSCTEAEFNEISFLAPRWASPLSPTEKR